MAKKIPINTTSQEVSTGKSVPVTSPEAALTDEELDGVSGGTTPRDAASGLATGKRQHKPVNITVEINTPTNQA
jgi:hypothetical protein